MEKWSKKEKTLLHSFAFLKKKFCAKGKTKNSGKKSWKEEHKKLEERGEK